VTAISFQTAAGRTAGPGCRRSTAPCARQSSLGMVGRRRVQSGVQTERNSAPLREARVALQRLARGQVGRSGVASSPAPAVK
jgi:hypothetical protein